MAVWMETGGASAGGSRSPSAASTAERSSSKKSGRFIWSRLQVSRAAASQSFVLAFRLEWFGRQFAIGFFQQDFDSAFRFFELLLTLAGKLHAFLEKLHGVVERQLRAFQASNDFFQARERAFEIRFFCRFRFFRCR